MPRQAVGNNLYLFEPRTRATSCIISSHGAMLGGQINNFTVPQGVELEFYTPLGASVRGGTVTIGWIASIFKPLSEGGRGAVESFSPGAATQDYLLTKFQGRHGNPAETYESLLEAVEDDSNTRYGCAVATIRNRFPVLPGCMRTQILLSSVINQIKAFRSSIGVFHCFFCRNDILNQNPESRVAGEMAHYTALQD